MQVKVISFLFIQNSTQRVVTGIENQQTDIGDIDVGDGWSRRKVLKCDLYIVKGFNLKPSKTKTGPEPQRLSKIYGENTGMFYCMTIGRKIETINVNFWQLEPDDP